MIQEEEDDVRLVGSPFELRFQLYDLFYDTYHNILDKASSSSENNGIYYNLVYNLLF